MLRLLKVRAQAQRRRARIHKLDYMSARRFQHSSGGTILPVYGHQGRTHSTKHTNLSTPIDGRTARCLPPPNSDKSLKILAKFLTSLEAILNNHIEHVYNI